MTVEKKFSLRWPRSLRLSDDGEGIYMLHDFEYNANWKKSVKFRGKVSAVEIGGLKLVSL
jgi:hypothetical protein